MLRQAHVNQLAAQLWGLTSAARREAQLSLAASGQGGSHEYRSFGAS